MLKGPSFSNIHVTGPQYQNTYLVCLFKTKNLNNCQVEQSFQRYDGAPWRYAGLQHKRDISGFGTLPSRTQSLFEIYFISRALFLVIEASSFKPAKYNYKKHIPKIDPPTLTTGPYLRKFPEGRRPNTNIHRKKHHKTF